MRGNCNVDDKLVISKALDTVNLSEKRFCPCFYGFLNEHEAQIIRDNIFHSDLLFWGGFSDAQRVVMGVNADDTEIFPITALKFTYKKEYKLSHRDFLGSLMSLGITRASIGDIIVSDGSAIVFVKDEICEYVIREITKIGRVGVKIEKYTKTDIEIQNRFDVLNFTVASLRIDVFVSAVCNLSRDKSQQYIKSDMVSLNHNVENDISKNIKVGDIISIRKYGKFVFAELNGLTKKGRLRIFVNHFR